MAEPAGSAVVGVDGVPRCPWGVAPDDLRDYHDSEWGRHVTSTTAMFERITLEAFQSGLSWLVILRKRERLREVFAGFDVATVAGYGEADVTRLATDPGIVRNRAKIEATISNARATVAMAEPLEEVVWRFAPSPRPPRPLTVADVASRTPGSTALAAELRRQGFRFVGPTTVYALMQATGMVDDHLADCAVSVDDGPSRG